MPAFFLSQLGATGPATPLGIEIVEGLGGAQAQLSWPADPGQRFRVERSVDLEPGGWSLAALVDTGATEGLWLDPGLLNGRGFYRISGPEVEVFAIDPPLLSATGGAIYLHGQCIPAGSALLLDIDGAG